MNTKPLFVVTPDVMFVRDDIAEKLLNLPTTRFSCGAKAAHFNFGDFAYFGKTNYKKLGCGIGYLAELALRKWNCGAAYTPNTGYSYVVVAISGSYGFGGLQQATKYTFSKRLKKVMFTAASDIIAKL